MDTENIFRACSPRWINGPDISWYTHVGIRITVQWVVTIYLGIVISLDENEEKKRPCTCHDVFLITVITGGHVFRRYKVAFPRYTETRISFIIYIIISHFPLLRLIAHSHIHSVLATHDNTASSCFFRSIYFFTKNTLKRNASGRGT